MSIKAFACNNNKEHICILVGLGLIGQRIAKKLNWYCSLVTLVTPNTNPHPFSWHDSSTCINYINQVLKENTHTKIDLIWCAGKSGFSASDDEMKLEYDYYSNVMNALSTYDDIITINLLSSAGGIYENSHFISDINDISPSRPYGTWKLKQEQLLSKKGFNSRIFRASSVYGSSSLNSRSGLINTLINCAKSNKIMTVYANQNTLRDYIYHDDIGVYITQSILNNASFKVNIIASGRPTSINVLQNLISKITGENLRITYINKNENDKNIIFSNSIIPKELKITPLEEGISITNARLKTTN